MVKMIEICEIVKLGSQFYLALIIGSGTLDCTDDFCLITAAILYRKTSYETCSLWFLEITDYC